MSTIKINGINIHYELTGQQGGSEAVVFLNGLMSSISGWTSQVPFFEKAGYKILRHDFRGQLLSDKPIENYTFVQHARDVKALLDQLGIEKIHIVSTSYGALVGMRFALDFPAYVKSMVMIDALSELDSEFRRIGDLWHNLLKQGDMGKFFRVAAPFIYSKFYLERNAKKLEERETQLSKTSTDYMESLSRLMDNTMANANMTAELHNITCPVLLACGEDDVLTPVKFSKLIKQKIPHAELVIVPECGHSAVSEQPDVIGSLSLGFVSKYS